MKLHIEGIGLLGPGLPDWTTGRAVLSGAAHYEAGEVVLAGSTLLPPAERRRMTDTVKLAMAVGLEATTHAGRTPEDLASVFTSSGGDGATVTAILDILTTEEREVSPTRFHNSVHNAPAGYWSIANHARAPSTSLCAHDFSFGAGLLQAAAIASVDDVPVLLVSYDLPYPPTLDKVRPIGSIFGVAMVLSPRATTASLGSIIVTLSRDEATETPMGDPAMETLRANNPTARALPLLAALAARREATIVLQHMADNWLTIGAAPA
ncbi:MAG TPA: beta-ketoacyl synthase chain length factor [Stellaceae bacterium]|jgi:hypothetical protein|nr:beta-ketoacyl synthase chain length factor [Stellaceae bacterium]